MSPPMSASDGPTTGTVRLNGSNQPPRVRATSRVFAPASSGSSTSHSPAISTRGGSTIVTVMWLKREYGTPSPTLRSCHSGWIRVAECPSPYVMDSSRSIHSWV